MSLEGIENNPEDAPEAAHDVLSYALDALSELHAVTEDALAPASSSSAEAAPVETSSAEIPLAENWPAQAASAPTGAAPTGISPTGIAAPELRLDASVDTPESHPQAQAEQKPEGEERLESLQSALDWYKGWLSSM